MLVSCRDMSYERQGRVSNARERRIEQVGLRVRFRV